MRPSNDATPSSAATRSAALQALLVSALALPGMVATAQAASDDAVAATRAQMQTPPEPDVSVISDETQEIGIQHSHYGEGARNLIGPVTTGIIPASPGSPVTGTLSGIGPLPKVAPITADGEHVYGRFRLGDRSRLGFDFVQDVWSGASPTATLPSSMATIAGATISVLSSYFDAHGKPLYQTQYQANANPNTPAATPQKLVYSPDTRIGHVMGYASPEARKQVSLKYGYDWSETAIDIGGGISDEADFTSKFGNVALRLDFNEKRTTVNLGLSYTHGDTRAEWNANGRAGNFALDAYPGQLTEFTIPGQMVTTSGGLRLLYKAPLITGSRNDEAVTAGVTQVIDMNSVLSTGVGYTHTTGFLSNPWKASLVMFPSAPDPAVLAAYPSISYWSGLLELEHRPELRNQFTWDTSYLHYFNGLNAAGQLHYSFFGDSWGIRAHTVEAEWRQNIADTWTVTPLLRYYTQKAANFYAPYFFALSVNDLPKHYFSSDERLSDFGTLTTGLTVRKQLARGLTAELGLDYTRRAGSLKAGGGGDDSFADLHSYAASVSIRGALDQPRSAPVSLGSALDASGGGPSGDGAGNEHARHAGHHEHADTPAGVMNAHMLDEPGSVMVGYTFERQRVGGTLTHGSQPVPFDVTQSANRITNMTMDMHMVELMVAQNEWLDWMLMPQLVSNKMGMFMNDVNGSTMSMNMMRMRSYMASGGVGDTSVAALVRLWDGAGQHLHTAQEVSIPTGSVNVREDNVNRTYPYDMQLGSGTWDWKPSLTYTGAARDWSWGGQLGGTVRPHGRNSAGYTLGDEFHATAWAGYQFMPGLTATLRSLYSRQSRIHGAFTDPTGSGTKIQESLPSDADPGNYGGRFGDLGLGMTARLGHGSYANDTVGVEWLKPVKTTFNGSQPNRVGTLFVSGKFMF